MIGWFRRGRHHVSFGRLRVNDVAESLGDQRRVIGEHGQWTEVEINGKRYLEMPMKIAFPTMAAEDHAFVAVMAPPGEVVGFPSIVDQLRHDVPVTELVEPWHGIATK